MFYVVNRILLVWILMRDGIKLVVKFWILELVEKSKNKVIDVECEKYFVILGEIIFFSI